MANKVGRPLAFKTVKELQDKIDEYFDWCDNKVKNVHSEKLGDMVVPDPQPYGMAGLAYYLGISRQTLLDYNSRDEFLDAIKNARGRVEMDLERRANTKELFTPGIIFNQKNNFGYVDSQSIDHTTKGKALPTPIYGGKSTREDV